jgi:hypothetical protein
MRVRIRRFTENDTDSFALDFLLSRVDDGSTLCTAPTGFTHFVCTAVPLSEVFGLLCSSFDLLSLLILSMFSPSRSLGVGSEEAPNVQGWPPSAAQTQCAVFPRWAFTKVRLLASCQRRYQ